jgi:type IV secretory pathway VirB2 component (pilin)
MRKQGVLLTAVSMFLASIANAIPSYSDVSGISSTLTQLMNWLAYGIGPGCVVISIVIFGYRLMSNDKDAWAHSKNLIIGALVIALAAGIGKALMALAQVTQ